MCVLVARPRKSHIYVLNDVDGGREEALSRKGPPTGQPNRQSVSVQLVNQSVVSCPSVKPDSFPKTSAAV